MHSSVHRFLFEDLDIRGALVQLTDAWVPMHAGRRYPTEVRDVLGEVAGVTALIGANLKIPARITVQVQGPGPLSLLVVDCDSGLRMRGVAHAGHEAPSGTLRDMVGAGRIALTLQGESGEPYQSLVPVEADTVAKSFEYFLAQSEQQPARLWLHASAERVDGLFLQTLPGAHVRDPDGWNRVQQLAGTVRPEELGLAPQRLLARLFHEETVRLFDGRPVRFHCPRDEDRVRAMLVSLGRDEVHGILVEQGEIRIKDEMCNQEYRFGPEIVEQLFGPAGRSLH
jgi:molecular chaperone Hsp33